MVNAGIAKFMGQPKNLTAQSGGKTTKVGAGVDGKNGSIAGNHFLCAAPKYGTDGVK
tara:strand:- start:2901 stop:3071 length:171 start_codon:yes stop_codon:yes gene_type:complete